MKSKFRVAGLLLFLCCRAFGQSWERQTWQTESGLPQNTVHAVLQSRSGFIWIGTEGGVARFDGYRFQVYSTDAFPAMESNDVRALAEDRAGSIWAATAGGVVRIADDGVQNFGLAQGLPSLNVTSIDTFVEDVVARTPAGTARWDGARFRHTQAVERGHGAPSVSPVRFSSDDPLAKAGVLCQTRDREGNIWVGTETGGLTVLRPAKFTVNGQRQGLSSDSIRCVFAAQDRSVWIGTNNNGLNQWTASGIRHFGVADGLSSDVIIALGDDGEGNLMVGTPDGLNILRNGKVTVLTSADGLADDFVRSIEGHAGKIYAGTRRGLTIIGKGESRTYTKSDGLGSDLVGQTLPVGNQVWIATLGGLSLLDSHLGTGRIRNYTTRDGLTSDIITALFRDREGVLWIGTQGGSLNCFRSGRFEHFPKGIGLPKTIVGITEDEGGSLWLAAATGVYRVGRGDLLAGKGDAVAYGTADGLRINECSGGGHPTLTTIPDRALWFATPRGAAVMSAAGTKLNSVRPLVAIESVRIDDEEVAGRGDLTVKPGTRRLAFEYAGLTFAAPQKTRYRYLLEPFDKSWIDAGTRRVAFYTNVPPGQYRFRVAARNNDGIWSSQSAELRMHIDPRFYQTVWFACLCAVAIASLGYGAYRWRVHQVALRYDAVLAERNRIAREIHDTLAQGFTGVSVQLEVISKLLEVSAEAAKQHLNEARKLVKSSLNEARRSIWELRSSGTTDEFTARLSSLTHRGLGVHESRISFQVSGALRPLPAKVEDELVRVAQEAVANAERHGPASEIEIRLTFEGKLVRLAVSDNGPGFETKMRPSGAEGHFGIDGMRERAEAIGGRFHLQSSPGSGTVVMVEASA